MRTLNSSEWFVVFYYGGPDPFEALDILTDIYGSIKKAENLAYQKYPANEIHNGRGDALKHCYLSALLSKKRGEGFAKDFMDAHEDVDGNPPDEKSMDLHNNEVGRNIAKKNPSVSDEKLGELCFKAVQGGRTKVIDGPGKNWP